RRQARALEEWPRLARDHLDALPLLDGGTHDPEGGAIARGGERARIAVGHDGRPVFDERRAVAAERAVRGDVLVVDGECLALEQHPERIDRTVAVAKEDPSHAVDRPEEIHRRRPRGGEAPAEALEVA